VIPGSRVCGKEARREEASRRGERTRRLPQALVAAGRRSIGAQHDQRAALGAGRRARVPAAERIPSTSRIALRSASAAVDDDRHALLDVEALDEVGQQRGRDGAAA
jgi:hypothetical protein